MGSQPGRRQGSQSITAGFLSKKCKKSAKKVQKKCKKSAKVQKCTLVLYFRTFFALDLHFFHTFDGGVFLFFLHLFCNCFTLLIGGVCTFSALFPYFFRTLAFSQIMAFVQVGNPQY